MSDQGISGCAAQYPSVTLLAASPKTIKSRIIARVRRSSKNNLSRDVSLVSCTIRSKACNMCMTRVSSRYSPPTIPFILRPPLDIRAQQSEARATTRSLPSIRLFAPEDLTVLAQIVHIQQALPLHETSQASQHRCQDVPPFGHKNQTPKAFQPCACLRQHESHLASHVSRPSYTYLKRHNYTKICSGLSGEILANIDRGESAADKVKIPISRQPPRWHIHRGRRPSRVSGR